MKIDEWYWIGHWYGQISIIHILGGGNVSAQWIHTCLYPSSHNVLVKIGNCAEQERYRKWIENYWVEIINAS